MAGCIGIVFGVGLISGLLIPLCGAWLIGESFQTELHGWLWSVAPMIVCTGIYQAANAWCTRTREFKWYSLSQVALPFMTIGCQILAALCGIRTASGLILGTLLGQFFATLLVLSLVYTRYGVLIRDAVKKARIWESLVKYKAYPLFMTPYTVVGTIRERLVYFLFSISGERASLGFYNLSSRLVNLPNSLVSSAVRPVFFQHAASADFRLLEIPVLRALRFLTVCVVPFWVIFIFHAEELFAFCFGEPWKEAGLYAVILSVPAVALLLSNWLDRAFDTLGRQRLAFTLELVFSIMSILGLAFGILLFKSVFIAICFQATVLTLYYSYWLFALFRVAGYRMHGLLRLLLFFIEMALISAVISGLFLSAFSVLPAVLCNGASAAMIAIAYFMYEWKQMR